MEMLGIHNWQRNAFQPPDRLRPELRSKIANPYGDLDAYVVHFDDERFRGEQMRKILDALSERMHAALPRTCLYMVDALQQAGVRERLYTTVAGGVVSGDLLVNNVGVSAAYQSPPHFDLNDVGWTFAFACKCGVLNKRPAPAPKPAPLIASPTPPPDES